MILNILLHITVHSNESHYLFLDLPGHLVPIGLPSPMIFANLLSAILHMCSSHSLRLYTIQSTISSMLQGLRISWLHICYLLCTPTCIPKSLANVRYYVKNISVYYWQNNGTYPTVRPRKNYKSKFLSKLKLCYKLKSKVKF